MTIPSERTRALVYTLHFLRDLQDPKVTPRVPAWVRGHAKALERHYPGVADIEMAHMSCPAWFGPVAPFLKQGEVGARPTRPRKGGGE